MSDIQKKETTFNYRTVENGTKAYTERKAEFDERGIAYDNITDEGGNIVGIKRKPETVNIPVLDVNNMESDAHIAYVQALIANDVYAAAKLIVDAGGADVQEKLDAIDFNTLVEAAARKARASTGGTSRVKFSPELLEAAAESFQAYLVAEGKKEGAITIMLKGVTTKFGKGFCKEVGKVQILEIIAGSIAAWFEDLDADSAATFAQFVEVSTKNIDDYIESTKEVNLDDMFA